MSGFLTDFLITAMIIACIYTLLALFLSQQEKRIAIFSSQQKREILAPIQSCTSKEVFEGVTTSQCIQGNSILATLAGY